MNEQKKKERKKIIDKCVTGWFRRKSGLQEIVDVVICDCVLTQFIHIAMLISVSTMQGECTFNLPHLPSFRIGDD